MATPTVPKVTKATPLSRKLGFSEGFQTVAHNVSVGMGNLIVRAHIGGTSALLTEMDINDTAKLLIKRHPLLRSKPCMKNKDVYIEEIPIDRMDMNVTYQTIAASATTEEVLEATDRLEQTLSNSDFRTGQPMLLGWVSTAGNQACPSCQAQTKETCECVQTETASDTTVDEASQADSRGGCGLVIVLAHAICDARSVLSLAREFVSIADTMLGKRLAIYKGKQNRNDNLGGPSATQTSDTTATKRLIPSIGSLMTLEECGLATLPVPHPITAYIPRRLMGSLGLCRSISTIAKGTMAVVNCGKLGYALEPAKTMNRTELHRIRKHCIRNEQLQALVARSRADNVTVHSLLHAAVTLAFVEYLLQHRGDKLKSCTRTKCKGVMAQATIDLRPKTDKLWDDMELINCAGSLATLVPEFSPEKVSQSAEAFLKVACDIQRINRQQIKRQSPWAGLRTMNLAKPGSAQDKVERMFGEGQVPLLANAGVVPIVTGLNNLTLNNLYYYLKVVSGLISVCATTYDDNLTLVFCTGSEGLSDAAFETFGTSVRESVVKLC